MNSMKKSLFITIDFPPQHGGVATYISHICKHIVPNKIVVLANNNTESNATFDKQQEYKIIRKNFYPNWKLLFKLAYQTIKNENIEVIQISHVLPLGYITLLFKKLLSIPYIVYLHGLDFQLALQTKKKKYWLNKILKNAQDIIVNSNKTRELVLSEFPYLVSNITILYPCPHEDLNKYSIDEAITQKYKNKKILLTVARIVRRKGHELVLQILPQLIKNFPDLKYIIVGTGPYESTLRNIVQKNNLDDYVDFIGAIDQNLLPSYYTNADIFVMPNQELGADIEGFGITFLEANLFKKPVIGGNNGGAVEAILHGKTGYLIRDNSQKELYTYINDLFNDSALRQQIGEQGYKRVLEKFTWEIQTSKLKNILVK